MKHDTKTFKMSFPVGGRTYTITVDMAKHLVLETWKPNEPLLVKWLPQDQLRQIHEARSQFMKAVKDVYGQEPDIRYGEYKQHRWQDVMR